MSLPDYAQPHHFDMLVVVEFSASHYGESVARLLTLDGGGARAMPLAPPGCGSEEARLALSTARAGDLFPNSFSPQGAMSGLFLYFSCLDEAHTLAQGLSTAEGSFWHGIMHRQEPDAANAGYWFRRVGRHPIFRALHTEAHRLRFDT